MNNYNSSNKSSNRQLQPKDRSRRRDPVTVHELDPIKEVVSVESGRTQQGDQAKAGSAARLNSLISEETGRLVSRGGTEEQGAISAVAADTAAAHAKHTVNKARIVQVADRVDMVVDELGEHDQALDMILTKLDENGFLDEGKVSAFDQFKLSGRVRIGGKSLDLRTLLLAVIVTRSARITEAPAAPREYMSFLYSDTPQAEVYQPTGHIDGTFGFESPVSNGYSEGLLSGYAVDATLTAVTTKYNARLHTHIRAAKVTATEISVAWYPIADVFSSSLKDGDTFPASFKTGYLNIDCVAVPLGVFAMNSGSSQVAASIPNFTKGDVGKISLGAQLARFRPLGITHGIDAFGALFAAVGLSSTDSGILNALAPFTDTLLNGFLKLPVGMVVNTSTLPK